MHTPWKLTLPHTILTWELLSQHTNIESHLKVHYAPAGAGYSNSETFGKPNYSLIITEK